MSIEVENLSDINGNCTIDMRVEPSSPSQTLALECEWPTQSLAGGRLDPKTPQTEPTLLTPQEPKKRQFIPLSCGEGWTQDAPMPK